MKQFKDYSIPTQVPSHVFKAEKQISTSKTAKSYDSSKWIYFSSNLINNPIQSIKQ